MENKFNMTLEEHGTYKLFVTTIKWENDDTRLEVLLEEEDFINENEILPERLKIMNKILENQLEWDKKIKEIIFNTFEEYIFIPISDCNKYIEDIKNEVIMNKEDIQNLQNGVISKEFFIKNIKIENFTIKYDDYLKNSTEIWIFIKPMIFLEENIVAIIDIDTNTIYADVY